MVSWEQFAAEAPDLARMVRAVLEAETSHVLATLRRDGSPRVSGTEVAFTQTDLTMGSMLGAMKARDLQRDGRCAIHARPGEGGDAKVSGTAVEVAPAESERRGSHLFRLELEQAVFTAIGDDGRHLLIQSWHPGQPVQRAKRYWRLVPQMYARGSRRDRSSTPVMRVGPSVPSTATPTPSWRSSPAF